MIVVVKYGSYEIFSLKSKIFKILSLVMKTREVSFSTAEVELNYNINNKPEK